MSTSFHRAVRLTILSVGIVLFVLVVPPFLAADVALVSHTLSDNGDDDGYADTNETVELRITVANRRDSALTGVTALLATEGPEIECLVQHVVYVGDLAAGETRFIDTPFAFKVADVNRVDPFQELTALFRISMTSNESTALEVASGEVTLELDLDATGGAGQGSWFEGFESGSFGSLTTMNLDAGRNSEYDSEGYRCQYNDPDWLWGNAYGWSDCFLGANEAHADAFFWQLSDGDAGPTLPGRSYTGRYSAYMGVPDPDNDDWTSPMAVLEALRSGAPVNLGVGRVCETSRTIACSGDPDCPPGESCVGVVSELTFKQQVDFPDSRIVNSRPGRSAHGAAIGVQLADESGDPLGDWIKIHAYANSYDEQREDNYNDCQFDPVDDGNTEDDFFDPSDPERRLGPSTLCYPEFVFAYMGDTDGPFDPNETGNGGDGPGLAGASGLGTWVESRFNLQRFHGRRIRIRLLNSGIKAGTAETYEDLFLWNPIAGDDGWWIDDILITDTLTVPALLSTDTKDNSGLPEVVDGDLDGYCDSDCDDADPLCHIDCRDADSDGTRLCNADCDDAHAGVHPGAEELCDGVSNDCDHPQWPLVDYWTPATIVEPPAPAGSVVAADLDGDGDLDASSVWWSWETAAWHENAAGDGSVWVTRTVSTTASAFAGVHAADLDGDDDMDLLTASYSTATIEWHENTAGDGSAWTERTITTGAFYVAGLTAADVDGDGDLDVLAAAGDTDRTFWYENVTGDGLSWADRPLVPPSSRAEAVDTADIDRDGHLDVVVAGRYHTEWYENDNGDGSSWTGHTIEEQSQDDSLSIGDLDGDEDADLLAGRSEEGSVSWYENTGNGSTWTRHLLSDSATDVQAVVAVDLDGDGDMDALSAAAGKDEVTWYENSAGDGSVWVARPISWTAEGAASVCIGDVDDDGDLDVLSAGTDEVAWYYRGNLETDQDHDGIAECAGDCDDTDFDVWYVPGEVRELTLLEDRQTLVWTAPAEPGGTGLLYDTLRAPSPDGFAGGTCVESGDGSDTESVDADAIAPGSLYYYLVVATNPCGRGSAGTVSSEVEREVCACP